MHDPAGKTPGPSFGIEEEYFLVDPLTRDIPPCPPHGFIATCQAEFGERLCAEMFQSQIELATPILHHLNDARDQLLEGRQCLIAIAERFDLEVVSVSAHPFADWRKQLATKEGSYPQLFADHQMVAQRSLLSGLHVHVGIPEGHDRIQVMNRVLPWVPLLLALSSSSPFWSGRSTGLKSYRQAMCGEWPRMGMPEHFADESAFNAYVQMLVGAQAIRKANDIWWSVRPSARYPTLELRIADACPLVEDALCIVGLFRALVAHALTLSGGVADGHGQRLVTGENYWRARRFGVQAQFLDNAATTLENLPTWLDRAEALLGEHCTDHHVFARARHIASSGSSADRQLARFDQALETPVSASEALVRVVASLVEETGRVE